MNLFWIFRCGCIQSWIEPINLVFFADVFGGTRINPSIKISRNILTNTEKEASR